MNEEPTIPGQPSEQHIGKAEGRSSSPRADKAHRSTATADHPSCRLFRAANPFEGLAKAAVTQNGVGHVVEVQRGDLRLDQRPGAPEQMGGLNQMHFSEERDPIEAERRSEDGGI